MGSSLPDKLYNQKDDGTATRDPGVLNMKKEGEEEGSPPKPSRRDLEDAIEHASFELGDYFDNELFRVTLSDFNLSYLGKLSISQLENYDDLSSWMDEIEDEEELIGFRGPKWAAKAVSWKNSIPPIIIVTSDDPPYSSISDGRGRVTYANYKKLPVHAWELKWKGTIKGEKPIEEVVSKLNMKKEVFYHGTTAMLKPGDEVLPPSITGQQSEKGRKKNLDKVFVTKDLGSAKIYAGRAKHSLGGNPSVYIVEPIGDLEVINSKPGTTVIAAPKARILKKLL